MNYLDDQAMTILADIFKQTRGKSQGVDAPHYRANHDDQFDLIDKLERDGFLRKEKEQYRVSLIVISLLNDSETRSMLVKFDKIFDILRKHYKSSPHDQMKLVDLAKAVEMPIEDVRECLSYMVEGSWWGGHNDFYTSEDAFIKPSESILRYKSFHDVITQLQEWSDQRVSNRIKMEKSIAQGSWPSSVLPRGKRGPFNERAQRQKPDWYEKLDSEFQVLLDEVYLALANEMRALPAMGLRTVIDMICNKLVNDVGGFAKKLEALEKEGFINSNEREILEIAIDVGHASAHRGYTPHKEDLNTLLDIVEHLLKGIYVLRPASQRLKENTPKRKKMPED